MPLKKYVPINLDVVGRRCLVVGGLDEALMKSRMLVDAGGEVVLVSPRVLPELESLAVEGKLTWHKRRYRESDLAGVWAIWNTVEEDKELCESFQREAIARNLLLNTVDQPDNSTFAMPALLLRGLLRIGVSTCNASPGLAVRIRDGLAEAFGEEFEQFLDWLAEVKTTIVPALATKKERKGHMRELVKEFKLSAKVRLPKSWDEAKSKRK